MAKRRVLILSASSGEGHVRAGKALEKAFAAQGDFLVEHIDALDYTSKPFQKLYDDAYIALVRRAPGIIGWFFDHIDQPWRHQRRRLAFDRLNATPMIRLIERVQPDLCVATHFLPAEILAWLKSKRKIRAQLAVSITDFDAHAMWLCRNVDRYYVALEETAEYLAQLGLPRETLRVTGIPIDPVFAEAKDRRGARLHLGLDPCAVTLLVAAGGHALAPVERLVTGLLAINRPWQIVAIAGKAAETRRRLEILAARAGKAGNARPKLKVVGFTEEMDQWMAAADILAGKAGGLSVSEALASGLPMAFVGTLPGPQEERNAEHVLERGAGIRCHNLPTAAWKIAQLLDERARFEAMRAAARALGKPRAAIEIARDCIQFLSG